MGDLLSKQVCFSLFTGSGGGCGCGFQNVWLFQWHPSTSQGQHLRHLCPRILSFRQGSHQKLQHSLRQHRLSPYLPRSTTLSTRSSIGTVTSSLKASTPQSPLERKIISSRPMASPPSKTLHKIPLSIYPVPPPLSLVSGLIAWLYKIGKYPTQRQKKSLVCPMNPEANLTPSAPKPLMVAKIILIYSNLIYNV